MVTFLMLCNGEPTGSKHIFSSTFLILKATMVQPLGKRQGLGRKGGREGGREEG